MSKSMNENSRTAAGSALTRRSFMYVMGAAGAAAAMPGEFLSLKTTRTSRRGAIVSFHMDQPYLDWSGTAVPYFPPPGVRSGDAVAHLTEEDFRRSFAYV